MTHAQLRRYTKVYYSRSVCLLPCSSNPLVSPLNSPALAQRFPSSLSRSLTCDRDTDAPLKTMSFRCFQIVHKARMHLALKDLRCTGCWSCLKHQALNDSSWSGSSSCNPVLIPISCQTCLANTQPRSRCCIDSSCWSQKGHASWCGSPRLASRSDVQHLFWIASQRKKRQWSGALDFQVKSPVGDRCRPMKFAAYAERAEKFLFCSHDQVVLSSSPSTSCVSVTLCHRARNCAISLAVRFGPMSLAHSSFVSAPATVLEALVRLLTLL